MSEELKLSIEKGVKQLEVLTGPAKKHCYPKVINITGIISAPYNYLEKRVSEINLKQCMLTVDRDKGVLSLIIDEKSEFGDVISGHLKLNPDFLKFGINTSKTYSPVELSETIRMNRYFFADSGVAMKLVSTLKNFKAKVDKIVEQNTDGRGNDRSLYEQTVSSNIPEEFNMHLPVFKGQKAKPFAVEISINGRDLSCSLVSPQINDIVNEVKNQAIDEQLKIIKKTAPGLAILEV